MGKKIVLVGADAAPSRCFMRLEPVLKERGFDVELIVGDGKPLDKSTGDIMGTVSQANIIFLGMSAPDVAMPEIVAGETAKLKNIHYGFYGDVRRCWARARAGTCFAGLASDAAFYFGVNQEDADAAEKIFPRALRVGTGNPIREENAFARFTREEIRSKLKVAPNEKLVLAPGGVWAWANMAQWTILIEALSLLSKSGQHFQLVLALHPGDRATSAIDAATHKELKLYEKLISFSHIPVQIVDKDTFKTSEIVPGADIIVEFGTSIAQDGAYYNVPVISLGFELMFRGLEKGDGSRMLEAVEDGISSLVVADASKLAERIKTLLTTDGCAQMRARQTALYPKPKESGLVLRKMADAIEQILAQ